MIKTKSQLISGEELIKLFIEDRIEGKKEFITWFLNNVMDEEAIEQLKAERYERNDNRTGYRNGTKKRRLKTVDGELSWISLILDQVHSLQQYLINTQQWRKL